MTTQIDIALTFPDGTAMASKVVAVRLVDGGAGGSDGSTVIADVARVTLDSSGTASVNLIGNDDITPTGTYYLFTVEGVSPPLERAIDVPNDDGTYDLADTAIQVQAPTSPYWYPAPSSGTSGQILSTTGTVAQWITSGAGVTLSSDTPAALGSASAGVGTEAARDDHVHAMPSAADVGADASGTAASLVAAKMTTATYDPAAIGEQVVGLTAAQTLTNKTISGSSNTLTNLPAANLSSGTVPTARLASGTASSSTFLRGDQTWAAAGGSGYPLVVNGSWTSGTNLGQALYSAQTTGSVIFGAGQGVGARSQVDGTISYLVFEINTNNMSAGDALIFYCYDVSESTGLPSGSPVWSQSVTVGATAAIFEVTTSNTVTAGQMVMLFSPSTNGGNMALRSHNPVVGAFGATSIATGHYGAIKITGQGATMGDVSSYTIGSSSSATRWEPALVAVATLVR